MSDETREPVNGVDAEVKIYDYNHYGKTGKRVFTGKDGIKHVIDYDAWTFDGEPIRFTWRTESPLDGATIVVDWITDGRTKAIGDPDEPLPVGRRFTVTVTPKVRSIDNRRLPVNQEFHFLTKESNFAIIDSEPPNDPNHEHEYPVRQPGYFQTNLEMDVASVKYGTNKTDGTILVSAGAKPLVLTTEVTFALSKKANDNDTCTFTPVKDLPFNTEIEFWVKGGASGIQSKNLYKLLADHSWKIWIIGGSMSILKTDPTEGEEVDPDKTITIEFSHNLDAETVKKVGNITVEDSPK